MAGIIKRGRTWYATWKENGRAVQKSTGVRTSQPGISPARCKKLARVTACQMERAAKGETATAAALDAVRRAAASCGADSVPSVRDWLERYAPTAGAKTETNRRRAFAAFLDFMGERAGLRLDAVTPQMLREFIAWDLQRVSVGTVGLHRQCLAAAFNRAADDEILIKSPMPRMNLAREAAAAGLKNDRMERQPFTPDELRVIFDKFPAPWCDMALASYFTGGQRLGDICLLRWRNIDFRTDTISFITQKTGKALALPIVPELRERLERIKDEQGSGEEYVFPYMARRYLIQSGSISTEFTALLMAWGIVKRTAPDASPLGRRKRVSPKSFHSIRHSVVTLARCNPACTPDMVRAVVGHDCERIERGYFSADRAARAAVLESLAGALPARE